MYSSNKSPILHQHSSLVYFLESKYRDVGAFISMIRSLFVLLLYKGPLSSAMLLLYNETEFCKLVTKGVSWRCCSGELLVWVLMLCYLIMVQCEDLKCGI